MKLPNINVATYGLFGVLAPAGCAGNNTAAKAPASSAAAVTSFPVHPPVPSCLVGDWSSTALPAGTTVGTGDADVSGGANIDVSIGRPGATTVGFTRMQSVTFAATIGSVKVRGWYRYAGRAAGRMNAGPAGGAVASAAVTGSWQPVGVLSWDFTRLTVELTDPARERLLDAVVLDRYTGDAAARTGHIVDLTPLLAEKEDLPLVLRRI